MAAVAALVHPGVEIFLLKECIQGDAAGIVFRLRIVGPIEESGRIQRVGIDIGEKRSHLLFHCAVGVGITSGLDLQKRMELGPRGFAVLFLHMIPAVMDADRHVREDGAQVLRRYPFVGILRVVVIELDSEAVTGDEVRLAAIAVFILGADVIVSDCLREGCRIGHLSLVRVQAVAFPSDAVRIENIEHELFLQARAGRPVPLRPAFFSF